MDKGPTASLGPVPVSDRAHAEEKLQLVLLSSVLSLCIPTRAWLHLVHTPLSRLDGALSNKVQWQLFLLMAGRMEVDDL